MGWNRTAITTKNGYPLDEVVSALQKSIRRGREEDAAYWALELVDSGMGKYLWRRLLTIAAEDIGIGSPEILPLVAAGWVGTKELTRAWDDMSLEFLGTILLAMCRAAKSREGDDFLWYISTLRKRRIRLEIPDYALDEHTARGRALQRGRDFWFEHAACFEQPVAPAPNHYASAVRELFKTEGNHHPSAEGDDKDDMQPRHGTRDLRRQTSPLEPSGTIVAPAPIERSKA